MAFKSSKAISTIKLNTTGNNSERTSQTTSEESPRQPRWIPILQSCESAVQLRETFLAEHCTSTSCAQRTYLLWWKPEGIFVSVKEGRDTVYHTHGRTSVLHWSISTVLFCPLLGEREFESLPGSNYDHNSYIIGRDEAFSLILALTLLFVLEFHVHVLLHTAIYSAFWWLPTIPPDIWTPLRYLFDTESTSFMCIYMGSHMYRVHYSSGLDTSNHWRIF